MELSAAEADVVEAGAEPVGVLDGTEPVEVLVGAVVA